LIDFAVADARAYERGGAHAIFVENFGDVPFTKRMSVRKPSRR
jgi:predicted TIM-barrel enzyme